MPRSSLVINQEDTRLVRHGLGFHKYVLAEILRSFSLLNNDGHVFYSCGFHSALRFWEEQTLCWMISALRTVERATSLQHQINCHVILRRTPVHGTMTTLPACCGNGLMRNLVMVQQGMVRTVSYWDIIYSRAVAVTFLNSDHSTVLFKCTI